MILRFTFILNLSKANRSAAGLLLKMLILADSDRYW